MRHNMRRQDLNKRTPEMIGGSAGPEKRRKKPTGASLAELAGGWSGKDAREFEESVRVFERIDKGIPSGKGLTARSGIYVAPVGFPPVTRAQLRRVGEKIAGLPGVPEPNAGWQSRSSSPAGHSRWISSSELPGRSRMPSFEKIASSGKSSLPARCCLRKNNEVKRFRGSAPRSPPTSRWAG